MGAAVAVSALAVAAHVCCWGQGVGEPWVLWCVAAVAAGGGDCMCRWTSGSEALFGDGLLGSSLVAAAAAVMVCATSWLALWRGLHMLAPLAALATSSDASGHAAAVPQFELGRDDGEFGT